MKKMLPVLLASMLAVGMLTSCSSGGAPMPSQSSEAAPAASSSAPAQSGEAVTITYLTAVPLYAKNSDAINAEFQKQYPNITVKIEHVSDNYEAVLKTKLATENPPDIYTWQGYSSMRPFVDAKQVMDLSGQGFEELVFPNYLESGKCDGKLYGIPTQVQTVGLLYNKDVFKKAGIAQPPRTITELKDAVEKVKAIGVQPFSSGLKEQWVCYDQFWFAQSPFVDDMLAWSASMNDGTGTFMNDQMPAMFELFDYIQANSGDKPLSSDFAEMCHMLASGTSAMCIQGDWSFEETEKIDPNANVGMIGLPIDENPENATVLADTAEILFVSSTSKNQEAAVTFIKWLLSKEGATYLGSITKTPSPTTSGPDIPLNPFAKDGSQWVADGKKTAVFGWNYWAPGIQDLVGKNLQAYFAGSLTLDQMVADLNAQWAKAVQ